VWHVMAADTSIEIPCGEFREFKVSDHILVATCVRVLYVP